MAKRKKDLDNSPEGWQQFGKALAASRLQPIFLSSHILGPPQTDGYQAKFSGHKIRRTRK